jgi:hypothetical protein
MRVYMLNPHPHVRRQLNDSRVEIRTPSSSLKLADHLRQRTEVGRLLPYRLPLSMDCPKLLFLNY